MTPVTAGGQRLRSGREASRTKTSPRHLRVPAQTSVARVVNERSVETYLRGVVPAEMPSTWPAEALQGPGHRRPLVRRLPDPPATGTTTSTTTPARRSIAAEGREGHARTRRSRRPPARSSSRAARRREHALPLDRRRRTENNENVFVSLDRRRGRGRRQLPARIERSARRTGRRTTTRRRTRPGRRRPTREAQLSGWSSPPTAGRTSGRSVALDLSRPRRLRPAHQRHADRARSGTKTVSGDVFRSVFNAGRPSADPMMRSTLFDTTPIP